MPRQYSVSPAGNMAVDFISVNYLPDRSALPLAVVGKRPPTGIVAVSVLKMLELVLTVIT